MEPKKNSCKKKEYIKNIIPFLKGRPQREQAINHEDIVDLEIILNTNDSIDAIIAELDS
jgi:hypothetical protein